MTTYFKLPADELDVSLIDKIKALFGHKQIEIAIYESEMDETEYVLRTPKNRERLLQAVEDRNAKKPMVPFNPDEE